MTEEEKEAIFKIREIIEYDKKHRIETIYDKNTIEFRNNIELMLNLVGKTIKENEELHKEINERVKLKIENEKIVDEEFIAKDKIRELLKGHNIEFAEDTIAMSEQGAFGFMLSIKELLEEG